MDFLKKILDTIFSIFSRNKDGINRNTKILTNQKNKNSSVTNNISYVEGGSEQNEK